MMRKIDETSRSLPAVRLFRHDIERIASILGAESKLEFRHAGYVYESIDELAGRAGLEPLHALTIDAVVGGPPPRTVRVAVHPSGVEIAAQPPATDSFPPLLELLESRSRGTQPAWWRVSFGVLAWAVSVVIGLGIALQDTVPLVPRAFLAVALSVLLYSMLSAVPRALAESTVYLCERNERSMSLRRSGATLVVSTLTGLMGLLIERLL